MEIIDTEVFVAYKALEYLYSKPIRQKYYLFIDSQATIQRIQNGTTNTAQKIWSLAFKLQNISKRLYIFWCPSHVNVLGNELADKLAKKELSLTKSTEAFVLIGYLKRLIKEISLQNWEQIWQIEEDKEQQGLVSKGLGKTYRRIYQNLLAFKYKPFFLFIQRKYQSAYIQLKIGIGYLKPFQRVIDSWDDDNCSLYSQKEDIAYLILYCKKYNKERVILCKAFLYPLSLHVLFCTKKGLLALVRYLESTDISTRKWYIEEDGD